MGAGFSTFWNPSNVEGEILYSSLVKLKVGGLSPTRNPIDGAMPNTTAVENLSERRLPFKESERNWEKFLVIFSNFGNIRLCPISCTKTKHKTTL